ncbi:hypothetical protein ACRWQL_11510 [Shewanella sp. HL-SH4]|uniref:hypothetical protein n=1 Tax=Shewanella sp. HL-SH4 TaxID=3436240 RepID=UPI003EBCFCE2
MSQWDKKFKSHPIHATLDNLEDRLGDESLKTDDLSVIEHIDRIAQLKSYAETCLESLIPALVNHGNLNNTNSYIQSLIAELNNFIANKNVAHLNNTASHIDNAMAQLISLPMQSFPISEQSFTKSLLQFKSLAEKSLSEIKESKDTLQASIVTISKDAADQKTSLDNLVLEIQEHSKSIETSLNHFVEKFENTESDFTNKFDSTVDEIEEKYKNYTQEFNSQLDEKIENTENLFQKNLDEQKNTFTTQLESQKSDAQAILDELEKKKSEASNLLQIIGNIGITGNYQNIANIEKAAADKWRNIALWLMISMVAVIGFTIFISATNGFDWKLALFRIGAALALAIPAAYAAKESAKHRLLENHNRRSELELASLDPYLEKLPEDTRNKVKEELTKKFFGLNSQEIKVEDSISSVAIFDLLKSAISKK